jgi:DNA-binding IclR family transcriptional regulator
MARPALSASRAVDIVDFLAALPHRSFTLTEISRAVKVNSASCHAILIALAERGYLTRSADARTYSLGSMLWAIGQAALKGQSLVARASDAAHELVREFACPVALTAVVGEEIVALASVTDAAGRHPGMRIAERRPLVAPLGAPFVAWSSREVIDAWIARNGLPKDQARSQEWHHILALTRQRGYQVILRSPNSHKISATLAELASGQPRPNYKGEVFKLFSSLEHDLDQPEIIAPDKHYDVMLLSAPLFDAHGEAALSLCLGEFAEPLSGVTILRYADRLVRICLDIMRADRAQFG